MDGWLTSLTHKNRTFYQNGSALFFGAGLTKLVLPTLTRVRPAPAPQIWCMSQYSSGSNWRQWRNSFPLSYKLPIDQPASRQSKPCKEIGFTNCCRVQWNSSCSFSSQLSGVTSSFRDFVNASAAASVAALSKLVPQH